MPNNSKLDAVKALWTAEPWGMLLENASANDISTDHSILVCEPIIKLELSNKQLKIEGFEVTENIENDPFAAMTIILNSFEKVSDDEHAFSGGFAGYLSYDVARSIENLPEVSTKDLNLPDLAMGFYPLGLLVDHSKQKVSIVGLSGYQKLADELLNKYLNCEPARLNPFRLQSDWQTNMSKAEYLQKFNQVKQYILAGDCYQVNLAQRWQAEFSGDSYSAYNLLSKKNRVSYSAFLRFNNQSILSVSPEQFIAVSNGYCETKPIKGTRPRNTDKEKDKILAAELINSEKDKAENVMIVDLLRNDFSKVCKPYSVNVPELCKLETYQAVHHLVSTVSGELENNYDNSDCLKACFPGGSITGAPKIRAMQIIEELEPHRRSVYCGSIGYLSCNGNMDTSICIRTLVCEDDKIYCWAGGGLVVDSDAETEYQETFDKVSKVLPVLQTLSTKKDDKEDATNALFD